MERRWQGSGSPSLLAALALSPSGVSDAGLIDVVWDGDLPANPTKALQWVYPHQGGDLADLVVREQAEAAPGSGCRAGQVDALLLGELVERGTGGALSEGDDVCASRGRRRRGGWGWWPVARDGATGPLAELGDETWPPGGVAGGAPGGGDRAKPRRRARERAAGLLEDAARRLGRTDEELFEACCAARPRDRGAAAALARYESYRGTWPTGWGSTRT